jgi:hypothetical protein
VYPTLNRTYFRMDESKMDAQQMQEITHQYAELSGSSEKSVVLLAVTNPFIEATVLFPNFFKLKKESERAAILLHEAAWRNGRSDYTGIVQLEMAAQRYFETQGNDPANYFEFYSLLDKNFAVGMTPANFFLLQASLSHDLKSGFLNSAGLPKGQMYLRDLLGKTFLECRREGLKAEQDCHAGLAMEFAMRSQKNPDHLLLKALTMIDMGGDEAFRLYNENLNQPVYLERKDSENITVDFVHPVPGAGLRFPLFRGGKEIGSIAF